MKIFFEKSFNLFDMLCFITIGILCNLTDNNWYAILFVPLGIISAIMQVRVENEE